MKFRVICGRHAEGGQTFLGVQNRGQANQTQGEVVDSITDLSKHNSLNAIKFEKVDESTKSTKLTSHNLAQIAEQRSRSQEAPPKQPVQSVATPGEDAHEGEEGAEYPDYTDMSRTELKAEAKLRELNVAGNAPTTKFIKLLEEDDDNA